VAALEGVRTPAQVARAGMLHTDHHLLVGHGAQEFARGLGFTVEADLNTENSRRKWLEWKRRIDPEHWLDPQKRAEAGARARRLSGRGSGHVPRGRREGQGSVRWATLEANIAMARRSSKFSRLATCIWLAGRFY
jgi:hypothetical protein